MGRAASISTGIIQVMTWMWTLRRGTDWTRELLLPTDDLLQRVANLVSPPSSLVVLLSEASSPYKHSSVWNHSHSQVVQIWCLGFSACAFFFSFFFPCVVIHFSTLRKPKTLIVRWPPTTTTAAALANMSRVSRVQHVLCCQVGLRFQQPFPLTPAHNINPQANLFFFFFSFSLRLV